MAAAWQSGNVDPTTTTTDLTMVVTAPTGIQVGDQLVALGGCIDAYTLSPPAGWTSQLDDTNGTYRVQCWTRTADSADVSAANYTFTAPGNFNQAIVSVHRADGIDTGTAPTVAASTGPVDTNQTCPSVTSPGAGSLFFWWLYFSSAAGNASGADKGTERVDAANATSDCFQTAYTDVVAGTGSITGATITTTGFGAKRTVTVAFAPQGSPTINSQPSDATVYEGETAQFSVTATASAGSLTYQWQVDTGGGFANVSVGSGGTTATYTTAACVLADSGDLYRCQVTDSNGTTNTRSALLTVIIAARIFYLKA